MTEQTTQEIVPNVDPLVDTKDFLFRFKKDKLGNKRANVELKLGIPSIEGLIAIIKKGGKELELVFDSMYDVIKSVAGEIVSETPDVSQANFPFAKVSWAAIATMDKKERATISAEQWEAYAADYTAVMPALTGKTEDQVALAVSVYLKKFSMVKTNKPVLAKLKEQLAIYSETPNAEAFSDVLELLVRRVDTYLSADEMVILADNL